MTDDEAITTEAMNFIKSHYPYTVDEELKRLTDALLEANVDDVDKAIAEGWTPAQKEYYANLQREKGYTRQETPLQIRIAGAYHVRLREETK